jgi:RNA polymerase sigma factor (sigma-70 family)
LVLRAGGASTSASRAALSELCSIYRAPLCTYARRFMKDPECAEDMVQDFLARLVERDVLSTADPTRGRFRAFLKASIKHHMINMMEAERAQKRGGGASFVDAANVEVESGGDSPEQLYDRQCAWALVNRAFTRLREDQEKKGHGAVFEALRHRLVGDDDGETLRDEAQRLGIDSVTIRVKLSRLRKYFGELVREEVGQTVARPEDVEDELRDLLTALRGRQ